MAELPIMPLNVAMLTADTRHMTTLQFGGYCRILFHMWLQRGRLPHDRAELRTIAGLTAKEWRRNERTIMRPFTIAEGTISQKRLTDVMLKVRETRARRSAAGIKGNNRRWMLRGLTRSPPDDDKSLN